MTINGLCAASVRSPCQVSVMIAIVFSTALQKRAPGSTNIKLELANDSNLVDIPFWA